MRLVTLLPTWLVTGMLCLAAGAQPNGTAPPDPPALALFLAVPDNGGDGENDVYLNDKSFRFHVVIRNVSGKPQKVWSDYCSWGYRTTVLEVTALDGKALRWPIFVEQGRKYFAVNSPMPFTLQPGEMLVREVHLYIPHPVSIPHDRRKGRKSLPVPVPPGAGPDYSEFPLPEQSDTEKVSVQAVFVIRAEESTRKYGVWTGRITSAVRTFTVEYRASEPMF